MFFQFAWPISFLDNSIEAKLKELRGKKWKYLAVCLLTVAGWALSIYLLVHHTRLKTGAQDSQSSCSLGQFVDCDAVSASQYSEFLNIPLASWGAALFFLMFLCALMAGPKNPAFAYFHRWVLRFAVLAVAVDVVLLGVQIFLIRSLCLHCLLTYAITLGIVWFSSHLLCGGFNLRKLLHELRQFERMPEGRDHSWVFAAIALTCFVTMLGLLPSAIRLRSQTYAFVENALGQFYARWPELPAKKLEVDAANGNRGPSDAKVQIVEYSDFQCPHCRKAAFTLHATLAPLKNRVQFVFRNFPLDSSCNGQVKYQMHPHACHLARLSFCAQEKGKFWEFHDRVFLQLPEKSLAGSWTDVARELKDILPEAEMDQCLQNPASLAAVQRDLAAATQLKVQATPSIFINGKPVTIPLTVESLQRLIQMETR